MLTSPDEYIHGFAARLCRRRHYNMFSVCPSAAFVHSFSRTDLVTTLSHEWLELTENI